MEVSVVKYEEAFRDGGESCERNMRSFLLQERMKIWSNEYDSRTSVWTKVDPC